MYNLYLDQKLQKEKDKKINGEKNQMINGLKHKIKNKELNYNYLKRVKQFIFDVRTNNYFITKLYFSIPLDGRRETSYRIR